MTPQRDESSMSARGLALQYSQGIVRVQSPSAWLATQKGDANKLRHDFAGAVFELRQYAALLDAHQLPLQLQSSAEQGVEADAGYLLETFAEVDPAYDPPKLFAHEAPGLGVVAITLAQRGEGGIARVIAHAYPLQPQALNGVLALLTDRYAIAPEWHALGQIMLDEHGHLGAPATALH
jgi:hypothetical protein